MKAEKFKIKANALIYKLELLIDKMPYQGDSCTESQKVCLKQALREVEFNVTGVEDDDFKPSKDC